MSRKREYPSKYRAMWTFAFFDLPVKTTENRKEYTRFRKGLMSMGFDMLQLSVYARYCPTKESKESLHSKIRSMLPPEGEVRLLSVTDSQFGNMRVFLGQKRKKPEKAPEQLLLF